MRALFLTLSFILIIAGYTRCKKSSGANFTPSQVTSTRTFITVAQANRRINSYLNSIGYPNRDQKIRSWIIDADSLRLYLQDTSIKKLKVFMAHSQEYIDSGNEGQPPVQGQIPETIILAGVNRNSNDALPLDMAMDNSVPCPRMCPQAGEVASPVILD